jgi:hypothetical protein
VVATRRSREEPGEPGFFSAEAAFSILLAGFGFWTTFQVTNDKRTIKIRK